MRDKEASDASRFEASRTVLEDADALVEAEDLMARADELEDQKNIPQGPAPSAFSAEGKASLSKTDTAAGKAERIVVALLKHGSRKQAAADLGISETTLWRWVQQPKFQELYHQARREAFSSAVAHLQQAANTAVTTVISIMAGKNTRAGMRVRVARWVLKCQLNACVRADLQAQIDRLRNGLARCEPRAPLQYGQVPAGRVARPV